MGRLIENSDVLLENHTNTEREREARDGMDTSVYRGFDRGSADLVSNTLFPDEE